MNGLDDDELRPIRTTVLNAILLQLSLKARLAAERHVKELEELSGQDLAPVRAQLDQIFGFDALPALPPATDLPLTTPHLGTVDEPRRRGRKPKHRPDLDAGSAPHVG